MSALLHIVIMGQILLLHGCVLNLAMQPLATSISVFAHSKGLAVLLSLVTRDAQKTVLPFGEQCS